MNRQRKADEKRPEEGRETFARQGEPGSAGALSSSPGAAALLRLQRTHGNRFVQRLLSRSAVVGPEGGPVPPEVQQGIDGARGGGSPLDGATRERLEPTLGADLSQVRVHTGSAADALNQAVSARAFTTGSDIFFRQGEYAPESSSGRSLLAHELTHVVQQGGQAGSGPLTVGPVGDRHEQEADHVADAVQRQEAGGAEEVAADPAGAIRRETPAAGATPTPPPDTPAQPPSPAPAPAAKDGGQPPGGNPAPPEAAAAGAQPGAPTAAPAAAKDEPPSPIFGLKNTQLQAAVLAIEGKVEDAGKKKPPEPASEGGQYILVQVPITKKLLEFTEINRWLAYQFFTLVLAGEGVQLDWNYAEQIYRALRWKNLATDESTRDAVTKALGDKDKATIPYETTLQSLKAVAQTYFRLQIENRQRYAQLVEQLKNNHYAEEAILSFYIAHLNGAISTLNGLLDLPVVPYNLVQRLRGKEGVKFLGRIPKVKYVGEYGQKYGGTMEAGVMIGIFVATAGAGGAGAAAGTGEAALGETAAVGLPKVAQLVEGLTVGGVRVGPAVIAGAKALRFGVGASVAGEAGLDIGQSLKELAQGKVQANGTVRPLTDDEKIETLTRLILAVLTVKQSVKELSGERKPGEKLEKEGGQKEETKQREEPQQKEEGKKEEGQQKEEGGIGKDEAQKREEARKQEEVRKKEEEAKKAEEEAKKKEEEAKRAADEAKQKEEAEARQKADEAARKKAAEEEARQKEEAEKKKAEEEARQAEEARKKAAEEEARKKEAEQAKKEEPGNPPEKPPAPAEAAEPGAAGKEPEAPAAEAQPKGKKKKAEEKRPGPDPEKVKAQITGEEGRKAEFERELADAEAREKEYRGHEQALKTQGRKYFETEAGKKLLEENDLEPPKGPEDFAEIRRVIAEERSAQTQAARKAKAEIAESNLRLEILKDPQTHRAAIPCFAAGTPVWTAGGPRPIEAIAVGDLVRSWDPEAGAVVDRRVDRVYENRTLHFFELAWGDAKVLATGRHPFWIADREDWLPARDLTPGMDCGSLDGGPLPLTAHACRDTPEAATWNLEIAETHNYFVGPGALVHNDSVITLALGGKFLIYRGTNPKFPGKVYIGQTEQSIGTREGQHNNTAEKELAAIEPELQKLETTAGRNAEQEKKLAKLREQKEFYEFTKEMKLEPLVDGLDAPSADYLEQRNIEIERKLAGEDNVVNRREQIKKEVHLNEVIEKIKANPKAAQYCPK